MDNSIHTIRRFNTTGSCDPKRHYMADISRQLKEIKKMIDDGDYFTINRARQYGKTTTLKALKKYLENDYIVLTTDFQLLSQANFQSEGSFVKAFSREIMMAVDENELPDSVKTQLLGLLSAGKDECNLYFLFYILSMWCKKSKKQIVLMIDEVDSASNNEVFLDFLAQLRGYYIHRDEKAAFQSVILAGVYDVKNIKRKIRPDEDHKVNSPWNVAADFKVEMSFSKEQIAGMLREYETDHHTGMDIDRIAGLLSDYTSGYPFLVSRLCKLMDEDVAGSEGFPDEKAAWTKEGFLEAVKMLLMEKNTLFESLMGKLIDYPELGNMIEKILFGGEKVAYNPDERWMDIGMLFGFVKNDDGALAITNRIFETRLYNYFLASGSAQTSRIFQAGSENKSQFIHNGRLDMELLLRKFVEHFDQIYGDNVEKFDEDEGRRRFLLYLRPIINGSGNYYIEPETRNARRMDVVVDFGAEQFIIELKIWRGNAYNERGEQQLTDYLDYFHLKKGYMLSYSFNKKKKIGVKEIRLGDRVLIEAVV